MEIEIRRTSNNYKKDPVSLAIKGRKKRWRGEISPDEFVKYLLEIKHQFKVFRRTIKYKKKHPRSKDILVIDIDDGPPDNPKNLGFIAGS